MDGFDSILEHVDSFGTYQRLLLAFILLPGFVPVGFHAYNQLFMAAVPEHYCKIPILQSLNFTEEQIKNISIPRQPSISNEFGSYSHCFMFDLSYENLSEYFKSEINFEKLYQALPERTDVVPCKYGWHYDRTVYTSTVVTEWDLVCENGFLPTMSLVALGLGGIVGTLVFGILQDSMGRKPSFFIYLGIQCLFGCGTGLASNYWMWLLMRIGVGLTVPALMSTPFVLALEIVGAEKRSLCTILLNIAYSLCLMALPGVAYLFKDWRNLSFATTVPFMSFFVFWWAMPESPRWLFAHGKLCETEKILREMANVNGRILQSDFGDIIQRKYKESKESESELEKEHPQRRYTLLDLLKGKVLRRITLIITFIWFTTMGVYVGLSYYAPALGGDEYLNFFLAGLAEMPTYLFLYPCLDYWGRRWTLFSSLIFGGVACVCTVLVKDDAWIRLTLYCIGKFGISAAFVAIQQMAAEIYPTVVRGLGISFSNVIGMIGPALVPLVNYTGQDYLYLPLLVLGVFMVIGGLTALSLPETLGRSLPQTLEDAEEFKLDSFCPKVKNDRVRKTSSVIGSRGVTGRVSITSLNDNAPAIEIGAQETSFINLQKEGDKGNN